MKYRLYFFPFMVLATVNAWSNSAPWVGQTLNGLPCQGEKHGFGPYDYSRRAMIPAGNLDVVERAHFPPKVENLISGNTSMGPEGDIAYTLGAWPNHHRALLSIINYQLKIRDKLTKDKLSRPPECYLQRAIHFSPEDTVSYALYGFYLRKMGHLEDAAKYYEKAMQLDPRNIKNAYSYSLLLIDLKRYDEAVKYAQIAYEGGKYVPKGLKHKLEKIGVWKE